MSRTTRTSQVRDEIRRFLAVRPVQVGELDLTGEGATLRPGPGGPPVTSGPVFVLVRREGRPVGTLLGEVPEGADPKATLRELAEGMGLPGSAGHPYGTGPADRTTGPPPPYTTVVIATRERTGTLVHALDSMLAQDHPRFEIVVVDNAPATSATRDLVREKYAERVRYVCEPVPGLAVAHNRGVAAARGEVVAFTDDDVVADPRWLTELTSPFAADPGLGCTTGLILPARLRTPAQVLLESHGGFSKGFVPRTYDPAAPPADEPLFPFTAGRFGSGASMAFRTRVLREVRGFDPATGAGTLARGGDDLYGFVRVLARGYRLHYTPYALVWHHHRETWRDLETQAYGYGAGLGAYLTAVLVNSPGLVPGFLARVPKGVAYARALTASRGVEGGRGVGGGARAGVPEGDEVGVPRGDGSGVPGGGEAGIPRRDGSGVPEGDEAGVPRSDTALPVSAGPGVHGDRDHPWPRRLSKLQRRGMLYGPVGYLRARWALRTAWGRGGAR
ncbi:glycosyltransferase family 2 protein [Streptomyces sp. ST1015]|uniref:glycosyltransferase n=1 Tax=unclassified Streptomyces TaxID=2593676 RepID=UPI000DDACC4D|nr:glycosyltransferase [Streptomyces sp. ST1015]QZZ29534.1 glycosyltransferase [Streptomyces sp. ST1015]